MLQRCYSKHHRHVYKTYQDCTVDSEWHNFQNFAEWFYINYPKDGKKYQLDKDIKKKGNRVYAEDNCIFVTAEQNMRESHAKTYSMINPNGERVTINNMEMFCKENNLNSGGMTQAYLNDKKYKGWKSDRFSDQKRTGASK